MWVIQRSMFARLFMVMSPFNRNVNWARSAVSVGQESTLSFVLWGYNVVLAGIVPCHANIFFSFFGVSRALNSGVEYHWDQLNENVFAVHSSSRSTERPGWVSWVWVREAWPFLLLLLHLMAALLLLYSLSTGSFKYAIFPPLWHCLIGSPGLLPASDIQCPKVLPVIVKYMCHPLPQ